MPIGDESLVDACRTSPVAWIHYNQIRLANGDVYSFNDRMYLFDLMESSSRNIVVEKATGMGFSETFVNKSLWGCIYGEYPQGVGYIFPNETEMKKFVQSRFNPLIRDNEGSIGRFVKDTDTTYFKRVGNSNLYMDGGLMTQSIEGIQKESAALRGKQFDACRLDEFDMMDESILQKAEGRMGNSMVKDITVISNPTVENHKTDRLFRKSNQKHWFRDCVCGEWTCSDEEFPELISKKGCHCRKCKRVLGYTGKWVAAYPDRNDLIGWKARDWDGYQISQLNTVTNDPWSILQDFQDPPGGSLEDFWKFRMGRAYTPKENRLTSAEVYNCCGSYPMSQTGEGKYTAIGVDVGKDRYHYIIGVRTGKERFEVLQFGCAASFDDVAMIAMRMGVRKGVVDIRPYEAEARKFQKEMRFPVYLCQYADNPLQDMVWDQERRIVKCFRTGIFDITHRLCVEKRFTLPFRNSQTKVFAEQYCEPYKYKTEDKNGSVVYRYDKGNGEDHYRNAMNYFFLAAQGIRVTGLSGVGIKQEFVLNDTERYV